MLMDSDTPLLILTTKEIENYLKVQHLAEPEISAMKTNYLWPDFFCDTSIPYHNPS